MTPSRRRPDGQWGVTLVLTVAGRCLGDWHTLTDAQLGARDVELLLAKEVTFVHSDRRRAASWVGVSALELLPGDRRERDAARPRFACAALARAPAGVAHAGVFSPAPSPGCTLTAEDDLIDVPGGVVSAALPPSPMCGVLPTPSYGTSIWQAGQGGSWWAWTTTGCRASGHHPASTGRTPGSG